MDAVHIAAFFVVLTAVMAVVPTALNWPVTYADQDAMQTIEDFSEEGNYPYSEIKEGQRSDSLAQGDFIGGMWDFAAILTIGVVLPGNTVLQLIGCGASCGVTINAFASMFTGIVWFIYAMAMIQFITGRQFRGME